MTGEERERRDSRALEPELITDPQAKAAVEATKRLPATYDAAIGRDATLIWCWISDHSSFARCADSWFAAGGACRHRSYAGNYRPGGGHVEGSEHEPVGAHLVPELVEDMCDYVNHHWEDSTPIHLAAYVMWRLNWILHPFADGNGRTSRIVSYVVLSIRAGSILPGTPTIPDQIAITVSRTLMRLYSRSMWPFARQD